MNGLFGLSDMGSLGATEAEAIANTEKNFYEIPFGPTLDEVKAAIHQIYSNGYMLTTDPGAAGVSLATAGVASSTKLNLAFAAMQASGVKIVSAAAPAASVTVAPGDVVPAITAPSASFTVSSGPAISFQRSALPPRIIYKKSTGINWFIVGGIGLSLVALAVFVISARSERA